MDCKRLTTKKIDDLTARAERGDTEAQFKLGDSYYHDDVDIDPGHPKALKWLLPLAEAGNSKAQTWVGNLYRDGWHIEHDYAEALKWLSLAADKGDPEALLLLGVMHADGNGVRRDDAKAVQYYLAANEHSESGDIANHNLGWCYQMGYGVGKDYAKAAHYYRHTANKDRLMSECSLARMLYEGRPGVERDVDEAVALIKDAVEECYAPAHYLLGRAYEEGQGVPQDYSEACDCIGLPLNFTPWLPPAALRRCTLTASEWSVIATRPRNISGQPLGLTRKRGTVSDCAMSAVSGLSRTRGRRGTGTR